MRRLLLTIVAAVIIGLAYHTFRLSLTTKAIDTRQAATVKALENIQRQAHEQAAKAKAQQAEERKLRDERKEQAKPKAYRWKDAKGQWHIADTPPKDVADFQTIPLQ